jgi:hypothetical protein
MRRLGGAAARIWFTAAALCALASCGGSGSPTAPSSARYTLNVLVTTEAGTPIAGATVKIADGPDAGRTATTDTSGHAVLSDVGRGGFTIDVSAQYFNARSTGVTLTASTSVTVPLSVSPVTNEPPRIASLTASRNRAEIDTDVTVTATVTDDVTPVDQLTYQWTAADGTFVGTGPQVTWHAPRTIAAPSALDLQLTVIESYSVMTPSGQPEPRENRATASVTVHVNDSYGEIRDVSMGFLDDFANSNNSPAYCVRNFSDSCAGKGAEYSDVEDNRYRYVILSSSLAMRSIDLNADYTFANVDVACGFVSRIVNWPENPSLVGKTETVSGADCLLTAVYQDWHWWLCDSHIAGRSPTRNLTPLGRLLR